MFLSVQVQIQTRPSTKNIPNHCPWSRHRTLSIATPGNLLTEVGGVLPSVHLLYCGSYNAVLPLLLIAFVGPFGTGLVLQLVIVGLSDGIERCKHTVLSLAQSSIEA